MSADRTLFATAEGMRGTTESVDCKGAAFRLRVPGKCFCGPSCQGCRVLRALGKTLGEHAGEHVYDVPDRARWSKRGTLANGADSAAKLDQVLREIRRSNCAPWGAPPRPKAEPTSTGRSSAV